MSVVLTVIGLFMVLLLMAALISKRYIDEDNDDDFL
jgi:hypothetical protein